MILLKDLSKEDLQKIFGEEMGGSGGPRPLIILPNHDSVSSRATEIANSENDGNSLQGAYGVGGSLIIDEEPRNS